MKTASACLQCRESKRKCSRPAPGEPCHSCRQRKLQCDGPLLPRLVANEAPAAGAAALPWETALELVEIYLDKVHDRPHSIFHPATLWAQLRSGSVSGALICAICAIGAKFSPHSNRRNLELHLTTEAKRLLKVDLENACIENIQTCILLSTLSAGNCETSSEALYIRIASTMAEILHLQLYTLNGSIIASETARRIWWSLYMADRWCFSGLGLPRHMDDLGGCLQLPLDELTFRSLPPDQATLNIPWKPGLWAHMITLVHLFGPIQDLNRRAAKADMDFAGLDQAVVDLGQQLEIWRSMLPVDTQFTVQNLHGHQHNRLGGPFVTLHLAYHHYSTLLYFRFLENKQASLSTKYGAYVARCKHHASSFSSLLHLSRQLKGCEASYPIIGHMTTVSSSVLLHTILLGNSEELPQARRELSTNFEALIELQQYWPATSAMINRLMAFQNICLLSSTEPHKMDGWMVRFLLEHSLALQKRELPLGPSNGEILEAEAMSSRVKTWTEIGSPAFRNKTMGHWLSWVEELPKDSAIKQPMNPATH